MKRATIKDVAREAGVSISTVSNALNNAGVISEKTRAHVLEVAERLHYIPNRSGQSLRAKENKAIGFFVEEISGPYYGDLVDNLHRACRERGYELYIFIINGDETIRQKLLGGEVSGAIFFCPVSEHTSEMLNNAGVPVVYLNDDKQAENVSSIMFNSFHAGKMAAEYLIGLGHKRLMHIRGNAENFDSIRREEGMRSAMEAAGLQLEEDYCIEGRFSRKAAYASMRRFLMSGLPLPDAVFASNDLSAYGCLEALRDAGYRVPEDVSLIGCDDIDYCEISTPQMTTIRTSFYTQGVKALNMLVDMMDGKQSGERCIVEGQLIIRGSCQAKER